MIQVFLFKSSIAWKNLLHNQQRFFTALFAISFAVFLMFSQIGFRNALLDSSVEFIQKLNADLIMSSQRRYFSAIEQRFKKNRLYQARGFEGVKTAYPLYITIGIWKSKQGMRERPIRVFGFNLANSAFLIPAVQEFANALQIPDTLLADKKSRKAFGTMKKGVIAELSNRRIKVIGIFELGTDFIADGNLIMSDQNFLRIFAEHPSGFEGKTRSSLDEVDLGLLKASKGTDINSLVEVLNKLLPPDVVVYTKRNYIEQELKYWNQATPVGFVFALGTAIGFVVGVIVVYNIIYTDIEDNLSQYATLRAMGYSSSYLLSVVCLESFLISILGFFPGLCSSVLIYRLIANATGLLMRMSFSVIALVLILTIIMCMFAGLIAATKLKNIDPAEVYEHKF